MSSLKDAVEQVAALAVAKRRLEVQMQRTEDLLHREFETIDQYFEHGKTMHSTVGSMTDEEVKKAWEYHIGIAERGLANSKEELMARVATAAEQTQNQENANDI